MKVTSKRILKDYKKIRNLACSEVNAGHLNNACDYMRRAAFFMYNCNVIYADPQLEKAIATMAKKAMTNVKPSTNDNRQHRLIFYDYFSLDNRGLTEQYIDAFNRLNLDVLFIMRKEESSASSEIYKKLKANNRFSIYVTKERQGDKLIREIYKAAIEYKPSELIAHTSPWDVEALVAIRAMEGCCTRYLSNITDHAFWLGTSVFDYFLEFRDYGCNISQQYRGISSEQDIKIPYFPIINKSISFEGFPFDTKGKQLVVSGGNIYKIKSSPKFLDIAKHILDNHPNTLFLYYGGGDHNYLQEFSDSNNYEGRFFHFSERKDIYQIILHSTLYLNTYPLFGGLMTQIALAAGKLPLTLNDNNRRDLSVSELLTDNDNIKKIEFDDIEKIKEAINIYLNDPIQLKQTEALFLDCIPSPESFAQMVMDSLDKHSTGLNPQKYSIDNERFSNEYITILNEDINKYRYFFYAHDFKLAINYIPYYVNIIGKRIASKFLKI